MKKNKLVQALLASNNRGIFEASGVPKIIDIHKINVGDKVVLWDDSNLKDEKVQKGKVYTVSIVDAEFEIIVLEGIRRMYRSENYEYEIGWEYRRFCLPEDYSPSGIYLNRINDESIQATEFAGRKIYSKYVMDLEQFGISWKLLRKDFFAEIEHPQYEIMFQEELDGVSRFYLAKFQEFWLLLHRIRSETDWLIGDNIHNYSLAMMMIAKRNDTKPVAAQILLSLWLLHYAGIYDTEEYIPENLLKSHQVLRGGSNSLGYLEKPKIVALLQELKGKTFRQASVDIRNKFPE